MRMTKLSINRYTYTDDGYGGKSQGVATTLSIFGKVNISANELRPLPSGYDFYSNIVIATFDTLLPDDTITVGDSTFRIVSASIIKTINIYFGVEI